MSRRKPTQDEMTADGKERKNIGASCAGKRKDFVLPIILYDINNTVVENDKD